MDVHSCCSNYLINPYNHIAGPITFTTFTDRFSPITPPSQQRRPYSSSFTSTIKCKLPPAPINSDWRSFRACLIAAEQQQQSPNFVNTASIFSTTTDKHDDEEEEAETAFRLGQEWAHAIHEPETGCLLVATKKLDGVHIFERTVILLLSVAGSRGPSGVILNRPSLMSIKETRSARLDATGTFSNRPLFFGGPLKEEGLFLISSQQQAGRKVQEEEEEEEGDVLGSVFDRVMGGLYYGTKESVGCAAEMVKKGVVGVGDFRFFDGYCCWEREQLREEIRAGYWKVVACSSDAIGLRRVAGGGRLGLWGYILGLVGERTM